MSVGTGIESIRRRQEREQSQNAGRRSDARVINASQTVLDSLTINVSSTLYDVFVVAVDNPDDALHVRYIP